MNGSHRKTLVSWRRKVERDVEQGIRTVPLFHLLIPIVSIVISVRQMILPAGATVPVNRAVGCFVESCEATIDR